MLSTHDEHPYYMYVICVVFKPEAVNNPVDRCALVHPFIQKCKNTEEWKCVAERENTVIFDNKGLPNKYLLGMKRGRFELACPWYTNPTLQCAGNVTTY